MLQLRALIPCVTPSCSMFVCIQPNVWAVFVFIDGLGNDAIVWCEHFHANEEKKI